MTIQVTSAAACGAAVLELVSTRGKLARFAPGSVVLHGDDGLDRYLVVLRGSVKVQRNSESGRDILLYRLQRGDSCPLNISALMMGRSYAAEAVAETEVEAVILTQAEFKRLVGANDMFRSFVLACYASRMESLVAVIENVAFGRIDLRLASWLLDHADARMLVASQKDLAVELGTAREVVARHLKKLEDQGIIKRHRKAIELISPTALRRMIDNRSALGEIQPRSIH